MKIGLIEVSDEAWNDNNLRRLFDHEFRAIGISEDFRYACKLIKCESEWFDEVGEMERIPQYDVTITEEDGKLKVSSVHKHIPVDDVLTFTQIINDVNDALATN